MWKGVGVEVKIGVQHVARELVVETSLTPDEVEQALTKALSTGQGLFTLDTEQGERVIVPVEKLAYIDVGDTEPRRVGFG